MIRAMVRRSRAPEREYVSRCDQCGKDARDLRPLGRDNANVCVHCAVRMGYTLEQLRQRGEP